MAAAKAKMNSTGQAPRPGLVAKAHNAKAPKAGMPVAAPKLTSKAKADAKAKALAFPAKAVPHWAAPKAGIPHTPPVPVGRAPHGVLMGVTGLPGVPHLNQAGQEHMTVGCGGNFESFVIKRRNFLGKVIVSEIWSYWHGSWYMMNLESGHWELAQAWALPNRLILLCCVQK